MEKGLKFGMEPFKTVFIFLKTISRLFGGDFHFLSPVEKVFLLDRTVDKMMAVHLNPDFGEIQVEQKRIQLSSDVRVKVGPLFQVLYHSFHRLLQGR